MGALLIITTVPICLPISHTDRDDGDGSLCTNFYTPPLAQWGHRPSERV